MNGDIVLSTAFGKNSLVTWNEKERRND